MAGGPVKKKKEKQKEIHGHGDRCGEKKKKKKKIGYNTALFPGGPPPQYWAGSNCVNFGVRMRTGGLQLIWSYPKVTSVRSHFVAFDILANEPNKKKASKTKFQAHP